jgi:hypothetical protein
MNVNLLQIKKKSQSYSQEFGREETTGKTLQKMGRNYLKISHRNREECGRDSCVSR